MESKEDLRLQAKAWFWRKSHKNSSKLSFCRQAGRQPTKATMLCLASTRERMVAHHFGNPVKHHLGTNSTTSPHTQEVAQHILGPEQVLATRGWDLREALPSTAFLRLFNQPTGAMKMVMHWATLTVSSGWSKLQQLQVAGVDQSQISSIMQTHRSRHRVPQLIGRQVDRAVSIRRPIGILENQTKKQWKFTTKDCRRKLKLQSRKPTLMMTTRSTLWSLSTVCSIWIIWLSWEALSPRIQTKPNWPEASKWSPIWKRRMSCSGTFGYTWTPIATSRLRRLQHSISCCTSCSTWSTKVNEICRDSLLSIWSSTTSSSISSSDKPKFLNNKSRKTKTRRIARPFSSATILKVIQTKWTEPLATQMPRCASLVKSQEAPRVHKTRNSTNMTRLPMHHHMQPLLPWMTFSLLTVTWLNEKELGHSTNLFKHSSKTMPRDSPTKCWPKVHLSDQSIIQCLLTHKSKEISHCKECFHMTIVNTKTNQSVTWLTITPFRQEWAPNPISWPKSIMKRWLSEAKVEVSSQQCQNSKNWKENLMENKTL